MQIINRADALAQGLKRYFTGEPCKRGHVALRYAHSGICVLCANAYAVRNNAKTRSTREGLDRLAGYQRNWCEKNREHYREYQREYQREYKKRNKHGTST